MELPNLPLEFYLSASPVLITSIAAIVLMLMVCFKATNNQAATYLLSVVSLTAALAGSLFYSGPEQIFFDGAYVASDLTSFGQAFVIVVALMVLILWRNSPLSAVVLRPEPTSIFMMVITGMLVLIASEEFVSVFVGLELSSIGLYALVGYIVPSQRSQEGAAKYFILGSFSASILLIGMGLIYASTGTMRIPEILSFISGNPSGNWLEIGLLFFIVGIGFKLALVPFHLWAPDAYEAAPTGMTAFMATAAKAIILCLALRLFLGGSFNLNNIWMPALMFLAAVSMILGNIMALVQSSLKRMLAYSSTAHSGYIAIALCALGGTDSNGASAILFYLVSYTIVSLGAFAVIMSFETEENDNLTLSDIGGLAKRYPGRAFALATFMFSFAGMPPTVGFVGKFFVFKAAVEQQLFALVIIGAIGSAISLYYYLRVIVRMYMQEAIDGDEVSQAKPGMGSIAFIGATLALTVLLGTVLPGPLMQKINRITQTSH